MTPQAKTNPNDNAFWDWSLAHYGREGVEPLLLKLQDEFRFNVNLLLWACWTALEYGEIPEAVWRNANELTATWSQTVTEPLREARRFLKNPPAQLQGAQASALRENIKTAELDAEHVEQVALQQLAEGMLSPAENASDAAARARRNLALYAQLAGAARTKGFSTHLLESLIDLIFVGKADRAAGAQQSDDAS